MIVLKPGIKKGFVASSAGTLEKMSWGRLLARTFKIDITKCARCKRRIYPEHIIIIDQEPTIRMTLIMLKLPPDPPPIRPPGKMPVDEDDAAFFNQELVYDQ